MTQQTGKLKILHILDHSIPLQSGYTFRTRNILREQRKLGWETIHVTGLKQGVSDAPMEEVDGLIFYRTLNGNRLAGKLPVINQGQVISTLAKRIGEVIEVEKPDILHAHSPALNGLAALKAAKKYGLPVVYECRAFWEDAAVDHGTSKENGLRYKVTRKMETEVFKKANHVTTICEGLRRDIIARGIPNTKLTVIPNAVDVEHFSYNPPADSALQSQLQLEGKVVVGFIGSFYAYEGIPLLLQALPQIKTQCPEIHLLLVGGGPQEQLIQEQVKTAGLQDCVTLTGRVPHAEVQRYYSLVDIFAYPRLAMRLTDLVTPLKPLEAMAQGKIVVASDVGGHKELIEDGKNGVLFNADDAESLAREVIQLLANREQWESLKSEGLKFVTDVRNWKNSVANYQHVYTRVNASLS